ncbi:intraflagellar transport protein 88 homolog, partial [Tubulanus polymorphus]|uniref:intraflagellar transport protein 88 homolog n=1 Tax=Tubulanus polymorphus TaxID=672921 RepID=UPI003DA446A0
LKFLIRLCTDLGLKDAQDYANKLKKAEKTKEIREQRVTSGSRRGSAAGRRDREGSAGSDTSREGSGNKSSGNSKTRKLDSSAKTRKTHFDENGDLMKAKQLEIDASYNDPLGPAVERPKTAATRNRRDDDEFADEELGDDLLPE